MQIMPFAFSVFFFFFPAGLVLYSLVNNVLSIAQQWQITRMIERARRLLPAKRKQAETLNLLRLMAIKPVGSA